MVQEVKQAASLEIVSIELKKGKRVIVVCALMSGNEKISEQRIEIPQAFIDANKPDYKQAIKFFLNGIKSIPGYDGTVTT